MKVPGGKMVTVKLDCDSTITKIEITGDFFMYPEETLKEIEKALIGVSTNESEQNISWIIFETSKRNRATMIGVTPEAIASLIKKAISG